MRDITREDLYIRLMPLRSMEIFNDRGDFLPNVVFIPPCSACTLCIYKVQFKGVKYLTVRFSLTFRNFSYWKPYRYRIIIDACTASLFLPGYQARSLLPCNSKVAQSKTLFNARLKKKRILIFCPFIF